ncbi:MAG: cell division protein FtsZ [Deltaproteobacteria bacterium]|nr:cell division protein FtsZ [Deltaproteobacteria bacterium]
MTFEFAENGGLAAKIKVVGVGGGGGNAVDNMIASGLEGVDFIVANTDAQALNASQASNRIQLGGRMTKGLGAGANPDIGRSAALEDAEQISGLLAGADMVFITAGMGGGTGTGGAPIVAQLAREAGALVVGVVTKPFSFEGRKKMRVADAGLEKLRENVDALITIPNQRLLNTVCRETTVVEAFRKADDVLLQAVRSISDLINVHGKINLDFHDVKTIMGNTGMALMGTGMASGENRAVEAAQRAIASPLLEDLSIQGARGVIINFSAGTEVTLHEISEAANLIHEEAHEDAEVIFGVVIDDALGENLRVTVIATGFEPVQKTVSSVRGPGLGLNGKYPIGTATGRRENFDRPAFQTRREEGFGSEQKYEVFDRDRTMHLKGRPDDIHDLPQMMKKVVGSSEGDFAEGGVDDYDIPAFIRRQLD